MARLRRGELAEQVAGNGAWRNGITFQPFFHKVRRYHGQSSFGEAFNVMSEVGASSSRFRETAHDVAQTRFDFSEMDFARRGFSRRTFKAASQCGFYGFAQRADFSLQRFLCQLLMPFVKRKNLSLKPIFKKCLVACPHADRLGC